MNSEPQPGGQLGISAFRFAAILCTISFATVVFLLCVFRLLSFFIMPSLFFHLLFIGFPLGAMVGSRFFHATRRHFLASLVILQLIMIASIGLCLICKQADYLRAQFYDLDIFVLLRQIGTFALMFLPFFCAYGLNEFLGYQLGQATLRSRMRSVYAMYLFGSALAYVAVQLGLGWIGVSRMMLVAIALLVLVTALLAKRRLVFWIELVCFVGLLGWPSIEEDFLELYKGTYGGESLTSTKGLRSIGGWELAHQRWGRYALVEIMKSTENPQVSGFYNDVFQWTYYSPFGIDRPTLDALPFLLVEGEGRVLIIGAGGGRQVRWAELFPLVSKIVAVEIEPEVFRVAKDEMPELFDHVYDSDKVVAVRAEGRTYLQNTDTKFDLIFMPSVGGYPQMMLEPGNMIRTLEAYQLMKQRLTEKGVLAVWYPRGLDRDGVLTRQYVDTFRKLGMTANWYGTDTEVLIISSPSPGQARLPEGQVAGFFFGMADESPLKKTGTPPMLFQYPGNPDHVPITDDKPFLAGNVRNILTLEQVQKMFGMLVVGLGALTLIVGVVLRFTSDPAVPGVSFSKLSIASLLVGANFLILEQVTVVLLFRWTYVFSDSLVLGAIGFLLVTGIGSMMISERLRSWAFAIGGISAVAFLAGAVWYPPLVALAVAAPTVWLLGSFFPALFDMARDRPLVVFAMDALGAAFGSVCAFYIPISFGLSRLVLLAGVVQLLTLLTMAWLLRTHRRCLTEAQTPTAP